MRRVLLAAVFVLVASPAMAAQYLGDFPMSANVQCHYDTNAATEIGRASCRERVSIDV